MEKITGKTSSGFEYSFDNRILSDWGFISLLQRVMSIKDAKHVDKIEIMQELLLTVLGEEQTDRLIEYIRINNDGFAPVEIVMKELGEIIESKN